MTVFNLLNFPNVCRICLQSPQLDQMVPLDEHRSVLDGDFGTFLETITFKVPEPIQPYLPNTICFKCLEEAEMHCKYREKMVQLQQFQVALGAVKLGDESHLKELFQNNPEQLQLLFDDLDLTNKPDFRVEDLLNEYNQYAIASIPEYADLQIEEAFLMHDEPAVDDEPKFEESFSDPACNEEPTDLVITAEPPESCEPHKRESRSSIKRKGKARVGIVKRSKSNKIRRRKRRRMPSSDESEANVSCDESVANDVKNGSNELGHELTDNGRSKSVYYRSKALVKMLRCELCLYKTYYTVVYELHRIKHKENEGKTGFVCSHPYCLKIFSTKEKLKSHRANNKPHKYICGICGAVLKYRSSFDVHMERHVGITHFQCPYCSATFFTHSETTAHVASMHLTEDREECQVCGKLFKSKKLLSQHLLSHATERNFHCMQCQLSFKSQHQLKRHIKTVHEVVRFQCDNCEVSYGRRDKLRLHLEKVHEIQAYFVCHICVRSFDSEEGLQEHLFRHENPKELECGTCLIVCRSLGSFNSHTCITYQDDYICCGRDFKNHQLYNQHMIIHGVKVNARVRPDKNVLVGQARTSRKSRRTHATGIDEEKEENENKEEVCCLSCGQCVSNKGSVEPHRCEIVFEESGLKTLPG